MRCRLTKTHDHIFEVLIDRQEDNKQIPNTKVRKNVSLREGLIKMRGRGEEECWTKKSLRGPGQTH